jgi:hypothetical protein
MNASDLTFSLGLSVPSQWPFVGPEPVAIMEHPSGVNINFILNASPDSSLKNLLMDEPKKHTG